MVRSAKDNMELGLCKDLLATVAEKTSNMESVAVLQPNSILCDLLQALLAMVLGNGSSLKCGTSKGIDLHCWEADRLPDSV